MAYRKGLGMWQNTLETVILKCNLKSKILVFKKRVTEELQVFYIQPTNSHRSSKKISYFGVTLEVGDEKKYLGVTLESTGGWNKYKTKQTLKGNETLVATEKCLTRISDMKVKILENEYEMMCESRLMCGTEI
jgi:hypothetical protein